MGDVGSKAKILFVSTNTASFVKQDLEILKKCYRVKRFEFGAKKGLVMIMFQIKLGFWILKNLGDTKFLFIWFADYHSFLPTLFAKLCKIDSFLVIGGYDAAKLKEYNYGGHIKPFRSWVIRKSCEWATKILPVSYFTKMELSRHIGKTSIEKTIVVHNGIDFDVFKYDANNSFPRSGIVCVSSADTIDRLRVKGLDLFMAVARKLPDEDFTIVGVSGAAKTELASYGLLNVTLLGNIDRKALGDVFRKTKLICQFSRYESFGMALAEGMLCGCIPVTVKGIGAAEIVDGHSGVIADSASPESLTKAVEFGLNLPEEARIQAVHRIQNSFSLERRSKKLLEIVAHRVSSGMQQSRSKFKMQGNRS